MELYFPNSASLQNIEGFLRKYSSHQNSFLKISGHNKFIHLHPFALSMAACLAKTVGKSGGKIKGAIPNVPSLPYLIRMNLFKYLEKKPPININQNEATGRFIPVTQVCSQKDVNNIITETAPLLHATSEVQKSIMYVLSELLRNSFEHSQSKVGAFFCAQYFSKTKRIAIGIADSGVGIAKTISKSHRISSETEALQLALKPGISGATSKIGGNSDNAGAGLFFIRSIAKRTENYFAIYSGKTLFKMLKKQENSESLFADPLHEKHTVVTDLPLWEGTVIGIDINADGKQNFSGLLKKIRTHYKTGVKEGKKSYYKNRGRIQFK